MISNIVRRLAFVAALLLCAMFAVSAQAQCCGGGGTTAFYQPAAYTAYSPVAYQTNYSGWYPGYFLDRIRTRLWGSPSTYVAAYPAAVAAPAPAYATAYRPAYSVGYAASYAAPAAPACASCAPQVVSYAPAPCATCAPACAAAPSVVQAVHEAPAPCASCAPGVAVVAPAAVPAVAAPAPQQMIAPGQNAGQPRTFESDTPAPSLAPGAAVGDRPQDTQRPQTNGSQPDITPAPGEDTDDDSDLFKENSDDAAYFQAPKLFDPNDRAARRSIAPVSNAIYEKPVSYRPVAYRPISRQQAELDASGWVSSSR